MSEDRQTFTDPKTGQEIESTWLARYVGGLLFGIIRGMFFGGLLGIIVIFLVVHAEGSLGDFVWGMIRLWIIGLLAGIIGGVLGGLSYSRGTSKAGDKLHDKIARAPHRRRILRSREHQDVPDTAISRAQPPGEPEPNDAALSIADEPEETRLTIEAVEDAADEVPVRQ